MSCPVHGPGCFGLPEECLWIEADMAMRGSQAVEQLREEEHRWWERQQALYEAELSWDAGEARGLA